MGAPAPSALAAVGRIILFILVAAVAMAIFGGLALLAGRGADALGEPLDFWLQLAGSLVATAVLLRWIDRRRWHEIGLGRSQARPMLLLEGWLLGMAAIAIPALLLVMVGWLRFEPMADGSWWGTALDASLLLVPAALLEEVLVRGYPFDVLRRRWGGVVAMVATSVVFGLLHIWNAGATPLSIALVTLAGFFLGGVVLVTGSVWAAFTAHLAWNWTMAVLLRTAVSGIPFAPADYRLADAGPDWATGGTWGPEGGIGAAAGMVGGIAYLISRRRRRQELVDR